MYIFRTIEGVKNTQGFLLTPEEMRRAYYEQQHQFDMEDIEAVLEEYAEAEDEELAEKCKAILKSEKKEKLISKIAYGYRRDYDKYDEEYYNYATNAVTDYLKEKNYEI